MGFALSIMFLLGALALAVRELRGIRADRAQAKEAGQWAALRREALQPPDGATDSQDAYAVVMEMTSPATVLTLSARSSGEAKLFSSAGGVIADDDLEPARTLVREAQDHLARLKPVSVCPKPLWGNVRFNVLTPDGVFAAEETEEALDAGWSPLSPLYRTGVAVLNALREKPAGGPQS